MDDATRPTGTEPKRSVLFKPAAVKDVLPHSMFGHQGGRHLERSRSSDGAKDLAWISIALVAWRQLDSALALSRAILINRGRISPNPESGFPNSK